MVLAMSDTEPVGRPMYDLLGDLDAYMQEVLRTSAEEVGERVDAEVRVAMEEDGNRVVLFYAERLQDITSRMEEYVL